MSEKLKPCPFCGGAARFNGVSVNNLTLASVYCAKCEIKIEEFSEGENRKTILQLRNIVKSRWNRRS